MILCHVVSSVDQPYAVSDTLKEHLQQARKSLLIAAPYLGKNFVDMIRNLVVRGVTIKLLTKIPDERDRTHIAIETFEKVSTSYGFKLSIMCNPYLHAKFMVVDDKVVLSGSLNFTGSGIYYNGEILYAFEDPMHIKEHITIFNKLWNSVRNTKWRNFQRYTGYNESAEDYSINRAICEAIIRYFNRSKNKAESKAILVEHIARMGFIKTKIIETTKKMVKDGILYEPNYDMIKLANYQTNMYEF